MPSVFKVSQNFVTKLSKNVTAFVTLNLLIFSVLIVMSQCHK